MTDIPEIRADQPEPVDRKPPPPKPPRKDMWLVVGVVRGKWVMVDDWYSHKGAMAMARHVIDSAEWQYARIVRIPGEP